MVAVAAAAAPAVIIPVLGRYSLIHSALRPRLRFCLFNIFYIKAQPQPLCAHGAFLQNITSLRAYPIQSRFLFFPRDLSEDGLNDREMLFPLHFMYVRNRDTLE